MGDIFLQFVHSVQYICDDVLLVLRRLWSLLVCGYVALEYLAENEPHERLYKEYLRKECEREVITDEFQPVGKQGEDVETCIIRVIYCGGDKAHTGTHDEHGRTDYHRFKDHGVGLSGVEHSSREPERQRTADGTFQSKSETEFNNYYCPYRQHISEHINAALMFYGFQYAALAGKLPKQAAVYDIEAVKHIGVDCYNDGEQGKNYSLKLISWH